MASRISKPNESFDVASLLQDYGSDPPSNGSIPATVIENRRRRALGRIQDALGSRGSKHVPQKIKQEVKHLIRRWARQSFIDGFPEMEEFEIRCAREHDLIVAQESGNEEKIFQVLVRRMARVPVLGVIKRHRRLLIVGTPGSGKTTLIAYLATQAARGLFFVARASVPAHTRPEAWFYEERGHPQVRTARGRALAVRCSLIYGAPFGSAGIHPRAEERHSSAVRRGRTAWGKRVCSSRRSFRLGTTHGHVR